MTDNSGQTTRTIVWAIVVLFVSTMAAVVVLVLLLRESGTAATLVATVLPQLGAIAAVLVNLRATQRVAEDTHALTNGLLDSKVRAGVAEVVHPELVDPEYVQTHRAADEAARGNHSDPGRDGRP